MELGKASRGRGAAPPVTATGSLSPALHVVLRWTGAAVCGFGGMPHLPLRPPDLALLAALARNTEHKPAEVARQTAQATRSDQADLQVFIDELRRRGLLFDAEPGNPAHHDATASALMTSSFVSERFGADEVLVLATPLIFRVTLTRLRTSRPRRSSGRPPRTRRAACGRRRIRSTDRQPPGLRAAARDGGRHRA